MHLWINALTYLNADTIEKIGEHAEKTDATANSFWDKVLTIATTYGGKIVLAIVVLIIGSIVVKALSKGVKKALGKTKLDKAVQNIFHKFIKFLLYAILIIAVVDILGVSMSSVIAILASCGLAVGLALQGALTNLAGGIMILIFKPFKLEDYIEAAGVQGVVTDISIFYTNLTTLDNKKICVPNGDLMNSTITNYTGKEIRRVDIDYKITNEADAELVKKVLLEAAAATKGVLSEPEPFTRMTAVDDDTYIFTVRVWCKTADYWDVYFDTIENCSKVLQENGIDDPEERIVVRLAKEE